MERRQKMADNAEFGYTTAGNAVKKDFSVLPKIAYFKVQSRGLVGAVKNRHERAVGAWAILVAPEGGRCLRLASDVAREYGMVFKCEFKTYDDAVAAGKAWREEWGKEKVKKERKAKKSAEEKAIELLAKKKNLTVEQVKAALG